MAKSSRSEGGRDIVKHDAPPGTPNYLQKYMEQDTSLEATKKYRVVPRLKVIQGTSGSEIQQAGAPGTLILVPGNAKVVDKDQPFLFVPVMFFVEFLKMRDLKDKSGNTIMERTFDPSSELAKKAQHPDKRKESYDHGKYIASNMETLNFPGFIYGPEEHGLKGEIVTLAFQRGEFTTGTNFISQLNIRKLPLWSQVYELKTAFRDRGERKWWGIDAKPYSQQPNIREEQAEFFHNTYQELTKAFESKLLVVDRSDADDDAEGGADPAKGGETKY